jgi:hypothetical protein
VRRAAALLALGAIAAAAAGCGLNVQSADLFLLTRAGQGKRLTLLTSDAGTVRCNGGASKALSGPLLLQARDLATSLDNDAKANLRIPATAASVYRYTIKLQNGTISFPDTAAATHKELAQAELLAVQVAEGPCGLSAGS